ncbi:MAG: hypothetical protein EON58_00515 [Alphaproteobacteria bacterium]|nr:MAG: hypothetical protein EON58_00515 [Alphaproteobacteria bacterium]
MNKQPIITIAISDTEKNIHVFMAGRENPLGYYHWEQGEREVKLETARTDAKEWAEYYGVEIVEVG